MRDINSDLPEPCRPSSTHHLPTPLLLDPPLATPLAPPTSVIVHLSQHAQRNVRRRGNLAVTKVTADVIQVHFVRDPSCVPTQITMFGSSTALTAITSVGVLLLVIVGHFSLESRVLLTHQHIANTTVPTSVGHEAVEGGGER